MRDHRPKLSDSAGEPSSKKLFQAAVKPMHTKSSMQLHQSKGTKVLRSVEKDVFQNDSISKAIPCFISIDKLYTSKTGPTLEVNDTVTIQSHLMLLNFPKEFKRYPIDNG